MKNRPRENLGLFFVWKGNASCGWLHLIRLALLGTFPSRGRLFIGSQKKSTQKNWMN